MNEPSQDFDWEGLYETLGEFEAKADREESKLLNDTLKRIMDWVFTTPTKPKRPAEMFGKRLVALAWVIDPERFGKDASLTHVGRSIGVHKAVMSELTAEFSKRFGVRNKHQQHGWNYKPNENTNYAGGKISKAGEARAANPPTSRKHKRPGKA